MPDTHSEDSEFDFGPPEYLVYRVLSELREKEVGEIGRTKLHKLCILADIELRDDFNRNIGLPQYWYKFGRTLAEHEINSEVFFNTYANHRQGWAYYPANQVQESDFESIPGEEKDDIFQAVRDVVAEHGDKDYKELEEYQYQNFAPHDFVTAYADLRWYLDSLFVHRDQSQLEHFLEPYQKTTIEEMLDEMLIEFEEDEFPGIYNIYLEWDDTMRLLNDEGASAREMLEFTETFIEALAKAILRVKDHSHVSEEQVARWREAKDGVLEDLEKKINRTRNQVLSDRNVSGAIHGVAESYNKSIHDELEDL